MRCRNPPPDTAQMCNYTVQRHRYRLDTGYKGDAKDIKKAYKIPKQLEHTWAKYQGKKC